jgi:hypothetical protein
VNHQTTQNTNNKTVLRVQDKATTPHRKMNTLERIVMDSSTLVKNMHKALKEMGHEMPLGHVYEALAKANGHKSWNVAKTKNVDFALTPPPSSDYKYEAKVVCQIDDPGGNEIEIKKYYYFNAKNHDDALTVMQEMIDCRKDHIGEEELTHPEAKRLISMESNDDFWLKDWEVIYNNAEPDVQHIMDRETYSTADRTEKRAKKQVSRLESLVTVANKLDDALVIRGIHDCASAIFEEFSDLSQIDIYFESDNNSYDYTSTSEDEFRFDDYIFEMKPRHANVVRSIIKKFEDFTDSIRYIHEKQLSKFSSNKLSMMLDGDDCLVITRKTNLDKLLK